MRRKSERYEGVAHKAYMTYTATPYMKSALLDERPETLFYVIINDEKHRIKRDLYDILKKDGAEIITEVVQRSVGKSKLFGIKVVVNKLMNASEVTAIMIRIPGDSIDDLKFKIEYIKKKLLALGVTPKECIFEGDRIIWKDGQFDELEIEDNENETNENEKE